MKITRCKLLRKQQLKLLGFCAGSNGQIRSGYTGYPAQYGALLFYKKVRQVISHHIELQAADMFDGAFELVEIFLEYARISEVVVARL